MGQLWRSENHASKNIPFVYKIYKNEVSIWLHIDIRTKIWNLDPEEIIPESARRTVLNLVLLVNGSFVILLGRAMDSMRAFGDESSAVLERLDRGGVLVHEIDLFQRKTLGLRKRSMPELED